MTKREKIIKVIDEWANKAVKANKFDGASVYNPHNAAELADALIAAGIGDVSNIIRLAADNALLDIVIHKAEVRSMEKRVKDAEHRAEVAERALCNALNDDSCYFCNKKSPCECEHRDWGSKECITVLLRQAEKELAEEEKE